MLRFFFFTDYVKVQIISEGDVILSVRRDLLLIFTPKLSEASDLLN